MTDNKHQEFDDNFELAVALEPGIMQFFRFAHLPLALQERSRPFAGLAVLLVTTLPRNPERTVALRKLLEAKDAGERAAIWKDPV